MEALAEALPVTRVVLFGSYATGRYTAGSDIDLLIVYQGTTLPEAYARVRKILGLSGLEPHVYAEHEAQALAPTLDRMVRDGVVLYETP